MSGLPWRRTSFSCVREKIARLEWHRLAMFQPIGDHTECQRCRLDPRFCLAIAIDQNAREIGYLSDPPSVLFLFDFDLQHSRYSIPPDPKLTKTIAEPNWRRNFQAESTIPGKRSVAQTREHHRRTA